MKMKYTKPMGSLAVFLSALFCAHAVQAQFPVVDPASASSGIKDIISDIAQSKSVADNVMASNKTLTAIGDAAKSASEFAKDNMEKVEKYKKKAEEYKKKVEDAKKLAEEYKEIAESKVAEAQALKEKAAEGIQTAKDMAANADDIAKGYANQAMGDLEGQLGDAKGLAGGAFDSARGALGGSGGSADGAGGGFSNEEKVAMQQEITAYKTEVQNLKAMLQQLYTQYNITPPEGMFSGGTININAAGGNYGMDTGGGFQAAAYGALPEEGFLSDAYENELPFSGAYSEEADAFSASGLENISAQAEAQGVLPEESGGRRAFTRPQKVEGLTIKNDDTPDEASAIKADLGEAGGLSQKAGTMSNAVSGSAGLAVQKTGAALQTTRAVEQNASLVKAGISAETKAIAAPKTSASKAVKQAMPSLTATGTSGAVLKASEAMQKSAPSVQLKNNASRQIEKAGVPAALTKSVGTVKELNENAAAAQKKIQKLPVQNINNGGLKQSLPLEKKKRSRFNMKNLEQQSFMPKAKGTYANSETLAFAQLGGTAKTGALDNNTFIFCDEFAAFCGIDAKDVLDDPDLYKQCMSEIISFLNKKDKNTEDIALGERILANCEKQNYAAHMTKVLDEGNKKNTRPDTVDAAPTANERDDDAVVNELLTEMARNLNILDSIASSRMVVDSYKVMQQTEYWKQTHSDEEEADDSEG